MNLGLLWLSRDKQLVLVRIVKRSGYRESYSRKSSDSFASTVFDGLKFGGIGLNRFCFGPIQFRWMAPTPPKVEDCDGARRRRHRR